MNLLSYNIQYGFGADGRHDLSRAARVIAGADIACLQEVERHWSRSGGEDQPKRLQGLLTDRYAVFAPVFDMDASRREGGRVINRRRQFGPMILSRWPILWTRTLLLPMRRMVDPLNTQSGALEACIACPWGPLRVISLHLAHVGVAERLEQIAVLKAHLARAPLAGPPWSGTDDEPARNWTEGAPEPANPESLILAGDFNCEPGSAELAALLDTTPYHPDALYAGGLADAVSRLGTRLHSHEKVIAGQVRRRQLDHVFVSADLAPRLRRAWADTGEGASDHFPLWVEMAD